MNEELKEWLGITKADFLVYVAFTLVIVSFFIDNIIILVVLDIIAIIFGLYSIKYGSKRKKELSDFSNNIKKYVYHFSLIIVIVLVVISLVIKL